MSVKCYETVYKNYGKCICLENDKIRLIATTEVGPRIIFFGLCNGNNVLFEDIDRNFYILNRNYGVWYAYGGHRIWCAPEKIPETYFPDNSKIAVKFKNNTLTLTAEKTTFDKQFSLVCKMSDDYCVEIENRISNCSSKPAKFAPWSVTGLAAGGTEIIPLCCDDKGFLPNRTMSLWSYSEINDPRFTLTDKYAILKQKTSIAKPFKVGFNVTAKQIAYILDKQIFKVYFDDYRKVNYPDFCCNFESYTNNLFLECEFLGEEREYHPSETAVLAEKWEITPTEWDNKKIIDEYIRAL